MQLPVVAAAEGLLFDERIDRRTIAGSLVIFASSACIAHRKATLAGQYRTREPPESV